MPLLLLLLFILLLFIIRIIYFLLLSNYCYNYCYLLGLVTGSIIVPFVLMNMGYALAACARSVTVTYFCYD